jgi:hypothetical protein
MSTPSSLASRRTAGLDDVLCGSKVRASWPAPRKPMSAAAADALRLGSLGSAGAAGAAMMSGDSCAEEEADEPRLCPLAAVLAASERCDPADSCCAVCVLPSPTSVAPWSSVPSATLRSSRGSPT